MNVWNRLKEEFHQIGVVGIEVERLLYHFQFDLLCLFTWCERRRFLKFQSFQLNFRKNLICVSYLVADVLDPFINLLWNMLEPLLVHLQFRRHFEMNRNLTKFLAQSLTKTLELCRTMDSEETLYKLTCNYLILAELRNSWWFQ
jgi:hypothetical protein